MAKNLTAGALVLLLAAAACGAEPTGLAALVEQLGSSEFRQREAAYRQLQTAGPQAIPILKKALTHTDPDVRRQVGELLPALETAALLAPRRLTLKAERKNLREIFDAITKQTDYKIEHWPSGGAVPTYSFDFKDLPFWEALDRVSHDANLVLQQGYGDDRIRLQQQEAIVPHIYYSGPFRFTANSFQQYRTIDLGLVGRGAGQARRSESLTFSFNVFVEPRLPLLGLGEVKLTAAYDNERNSMLPPVVPVIGDEERIVRGGGRWVSRYGNGYRAYHMQAQVTLNRPSEKASVARHIRGDVPMTLLAEQKPVVLTDAILGAKGKKLTTGQTTFHIEDVSEQPNKQYQIKMSVTEANKDNPNDYTWMNAIYQRIELQDAKGVKYQVVGSNWGSNDANMVQLTLTYAAQGPAEKPSKFVFYAWTTLQHQATFEFRDLPLP